MAGKGKVLLMDDEDIILDVSREVLRFLGYDAVFAKEGASAVELYKREKEEGRPFDLVILDLYHTGGDGRPGNNGETPQLRPWRKGCSFEWLYQLTRSCRTLPVMAFPANLPNPTGSTI